MALMQIAEPGQSLSPHEQSQSERKRGIAVGIDLGTTNSLIAEVKTMDSAPELTTIDNSQLMPSAVYYGENVKLVGSAALSYVGEKNLIVSSKRTMGKNYNETIANYPTLKHQLAVPSNGDDLLFYQTQVGAKSSVQVAADILGYLKQQHEKTLNNDTIEGAVITVPAYFDDAQRQATKNAAKLAGIKVLRLLNEPTAAAIAYGINADEVNQSSTIVIYDLGGGTFDVSILRIEQGLFQVLSTAGDSALGGDDIDLAIAKWVVEQTNDTWQQLSHSRTRLLLDKACNAKQQLSTQSNTTIAWNEQSIQLSTEQMNELIQPFIQQTLAVCQQALTDANLDLNTQDIQPIDHVILVGGSTRIPAVQTAVAAFFKQPVKASIDPDQVVAIGAAIQADKLIGNKSSTNMLLLDVIPLSLGIEIMGGLTEKIIHRNSTIPVSRAQEFTTAKDGQNAMTIHVLQGERESVEHCRSLARFQLKGIPPMVAGSARIKVTFQVDADGLLTVAAREEITGVQTLIDVKPSFGLDDTAIANMIKASIDYAADDIHFRQQREQQVEAQQLIDYLQNALNTDGEALLNNEQITQLQNGIEMLSHIIADTSNDADTIRTSIQQLSSQSDCFAQLRMDKSIQIALQGKNLTDIS